MLDRKVKNSLYRWFFLLFKRNYSSLDAHKLMAEIKLQIRDSRITQADGLEYAPDIITIQISHEASRSFNETDKLSNFLEEQIRKYAEDIGLKLAMGPRVKITAITTVKGSQHVIICKHTPSEKQPTRIFNFILEFKWKTGQKQIEFSSGSFFIGNDKSCQQWLDTPGLNGKLAFIEASGLTLQLAAVNPDVPVFCEGTKLELNRKYKIKIGSKLDFANSLELKVNTNMKLH